MDSQGVAAIIRQMAAVIRREREYLTELDAAIGDADHGHNMAKGFEAVEDKVLSAPDPDVGKLLQQVGMTLVSTVGGASGPLYGTAFIRAGAQLAGRQQVEMADLPRLFEAAIAGIQQRGRAVRGEKTMLDALMPAHEALASAVSEGLAPGECLERAAAAAEDGVAYTRSIKATKGRASYLGERSIGHQDPGATSSALLIRAIEQTLAGR